MTTPRPHLQLVSAPLARRIACLAAVVLCALAVGAVRTSSAEAAACNFSWNMASPNVSFTYGPTGGPVANWSWGNYGAAAGTRAPEWHAEYGTYGWYGSYANSNKGEVLQSGNFSYETNWSSTVISTVTMSWISDCTGTKKIAKTTTGVAPAPPLPSVTGAPTISPQNPKVGDTITVTAGSVNCNGRDGCSTVAVFAVTGTSTYTVTAADVGKTSFPITQSVVNNVGTGSGWAGSPSVGAAITGTPVIGTAQLSTETPALGQTIAVALEQVAARGSAVDGLQYSWECSYKLRGDTVWTPVSTDAKFTLGGICAAGEEVRCSVRAHNNVGWGAWTTSKPRTISAAAGAGSGTAPGQIGGTPSDGGSGTPGAGTTPAPATTGPDGIVERRAADGSSAYGIERNGVFVGFRKNGTMWRTKPRFLLSVTSKTAGTLRLRATLSAKQARALGLGNKPIVISRGAVKVTANTPRDFAVAMTPTLGRGLGLKTRAPIDVVATLTSGKTTTRVVLHAIVLR